MTTSPYSDLIDLTTQSAESVGRHLAAAILENDESRLDSAFHAAKRLISWRQSIEEEFAPDKMVSREVIPVSEHELVRQLDTRTRRKAKSDRALQYTPASGYGPYVLLAFHLLGGRAKYRDAQTLMVKAMLADNALKPMDYEKTEGTGAPRYLPNSRSHCATLVRRGLLEKAPKARFVLSDAGKQFVERWLSQQNKALEEYELLSLQ